MFGDDRDAVAFRVERDEKLFIIELFHCPEDVSGVSPWTNPEQPDGYHFNWTGNSYNFNATGDPEMGYQPTGGLAGVRFSRISESASFVLFTEAAHVWGYNALGETAAWHPKGKANVCFADGHVEFMERPRSKPNGAYRWSVDPLPDGS